MKKTLLFGAILCSMFTLSSFMNKGSENMVQEVSASATKDNVPVVKFDTLKLSLGTFPASDPVRKCTFNFTNTGTAPLVIHQALASCGCTVPTFTQTPVKPGEKGKIEVTYNGKGKFPGYFSKSITVRSNAENSVVRLVIEGEMTED